MISLKLHCSCGQKFAFDVEPVNGRMPSAVLCPACGKDATQAANEQIAARAPTSAPRPPAMKKSRKPLVLGICAAMLVILLAGAGVLYWLIQPELKQPKPPAKPAAITGIGLFVGRDQDTHQFVVRRTFPNSPAAKAGIASGLILNKVDGMLAETNSINQLSAMLRGPVGTKVALEFIDPQAGTTNQLELVREEFENRSK
jgi:hypothetical protein